MVVPDDLEHGIRQNGHAAMDQAMEGPNVPLRLINKESRSLYDDGNAM